MKNQDFYMTAKTMFGLEDILAKEILKIGGRNIKKMNRAVSFKGDKGFMYKANLNLRTALRILKPISYFQAYNEKDIYNQVKAINWDKIMDVNSTFAVNSTTNSDIFKHSKYISLLAKDAIVDFFREKYNQRPNVDIKDSDISINLHIAKNTCTLSLDSSGKSLHKRGYKTNNVFAPINEVLAAGLIILSEWDKKSNFHDPMCGSGTILTEAAFIAHNIPPNIFRKKFSFMKWKDFDSTLWETIKESSLNKETSFSGKITGSDNNNNNINIAKENIKNALMDENILINNADFFNTHIKNNTFVIFNPPYGERLTLPREKFYEEIGSTLKHKYEGCEIWIISSDMQDAKFIGLKPSKKIKVMNGPIECIFKKFEIYKGSKKLKK